MAETNEASTKTQQSTLSKRGDRTKSSITDIRRDDLVSDALQKAVDATKEFRKVPALLEVQVSGILDRLAGPPLESAEEKGGPRYPHIEQSIAQRNLDIEDAQFVYDGVELTQLTAFETQQKVWSRALKQYEFNLASAEVALRSAVKAAVDHYRDRTNPDSERHNAFLYYTMRSAVASALTDYETAVGTAAGTLAGAAGDMLSTYASFASAIAAARSTLLAGEATAEVTFWGSVEQIRDG